MIAAQPNPATRRARPLSCQDGLAPAWIMLSVLVAGCDGGGRAPPVPLPAAEVVFSAKRGADYQLFSIGLAGSAPVPLTDGPGQHLHPSVSPDGHQVAYTCESEGLRAICLLDRRSSSSAALGLAPLLASTPSFSPDGSAIVFEGQGATDAQPDVYLVDLDRPLAPRRLTADEGRDGGPVFAPDGEHIYFVSNRSGSFEIWRMTRSGAQQAPVTQGAAIIGRPAPTPDGQALAYARSLPGDASSEVVRLSLASAASEVLVEADASEPAFSADGRWLAFTTRRYGDPELALLELGTGGVPQRMTTDPFVEGASCFSPAPPPRDGSR